MRLAPSLRGLIRWTALGAGFALFAALTAPTLLGGRSLTIMSGSMEPALGTGDIVLEREIAPLEARVGDIVTFRDPDGSGRLITHRVRSIRVGGDAVTFTTKGDAANGIQRWTIPQSGTIGEPRFRLPKLGYALSATRSPAGRLLLVALPALLLGASAITRIWRPSAPRVADAAPS